MSRALPQQDLSNAFAPPASRAAGIKLPPGRAGRARKVAAVPDPVEPEETPQESEEITEAPQSTDEAPAARESVSEAPETPKATTEAVEAPEDRQTTPQTAAEPATDDETPAAAPAPTAKVTRAPQATTNAKVDKPVTKRRKPKKNAKSKSEAGNESGRLVLWTPIAICDRMAAFKTQTKTSYLDQVLDALEAAGSVEALAEIVQTSENAPVVTQGTFFERAGSRASKPAPRKQLTIRGALVSQLEMIDQLVEATGSDSRSALVNAALDKHLPR